MSVQHANTRVVPFAAARPGRTPLTLLARLYDVWRSRRALERLDSRQLDDIGLSITEARHEAEKPLWDVPQNWLR